MADTSKRGFASMDEDKQREIASKGGKAAHAKGTAHEFTSEEAQEAGRKGGEKTSSDRERMSRIGREGGKKSRRGSSNNNQENNDAEQNPSDVDVDSRATDEDVEGYDDFEDEDEDEDDDDELEMSDEDDEEEESTGTQGGTREQHANAGRQSHKNSK